MSSRPVRSVVSGDAIVISEELIKFSWTREQLRDWSQIFFQFALGAVALPPRARPFDVITAVMGVSPVMVKDRYPFRESLQGHVVMGVSPVSPCGTRSSRRYGRHGTAEDS